MSGGVPRLTVLVTTFNHERYLEQALDSVLAQVTSFRFDAVIIDDCSTDRTRAIAERYVRRFPSQLRLAFNETNERSNRRFALEFAKCKGEYVAMLDGDDYWTCVDKLQRQVDVMDAWAECAVCFHDVLAVPEGGMPGSPWRYTGPGWPLITGGDELWARNAIAGCSPVFRRPLLRRLPSWYDDALWGDYPLYLLFADRGKLVYLDSVMGVYRVHPDGFWSGRSEKEQTEQLISFYSEMRALFPDHAPAIDAQIARRRSELDQLERERRHERVWSWRLASQADERVRKRIGHLVSAHVPREAGLIRLQPSPEPNSGRPGAELIYPPLPVAREQLFAGGSEGTAHAGWLSEGRVYEFRLYGGPEPRSLLATVTAAKAASERDLEREKRSPRASAEAAYITANPRLSYAPEGPGTTQITWSTGDGSHGEVYVLTYPDDANVPADDHTAIAMLERTIGNGGEFLIVPVTSLWWLEDQSGLQTYLSSEHRLVLDDHVCRIYDLRR